MSAQTLSDESSEELGASALLSQSALSLLTQKSKAARSRDQIDQAVARLIAVVNQASRDPDQEHASSSAPGRGQSAAPAPSLQDQFREEMNGMTEREKRRFVMKKQLERRRAAQDAALVAVQQAERERAAEHARAQNSQGMPDLPSHRNPRTAQVVEKMTETLTLVLAHIYEESKQQFLKQVHVDACQTDFGRLRKAANEHLGMKVTEGTCIHTLYHACKKHSKYVDILSKFMGEWRAFVEFLSANSKHTQLRLDSLGAPGSFVVFYTRVNFKDVFNPDKNPFLVECMYSLEIFEFPTLLVDERAHPTFDVMVQSRLEDALLLHVCTESCMSAPFKTQIQARLTYDLERVFVEASKQSYQHLMQSNSQQVSKVRLVLQDATRNINLDHNNSVFLSETRITTKQEQVWYHSIVAEFERFFTTSELPPRRKLQDSLAHTKSIISDYSRELRLLVGDEDTQQSVANLNSALVLRAWVRLGTVAVHQAQDFHTHASLLVRSVTTEEHLRKFDDRRRFCTSQLDALRQTEHVCERVVHEDSSDDVNRARLAYYACAKKLDCFVTHAHRLEGLLRMLHSNDLDLVAAVEQSCAEWLEGDVTRTEATNRVIQEEARICSMYKTSQEDARKTLVGQIKLTLQQVDQTFSEVATILAGIPHSMRSGSEVVKQSYLVTPATPTIGNGIRNETVDVPSSVVVQLKEMCLSALHDPICEKFSTPDTKTFLFQIIKKESLTLVDTWNILTQVSQVSILKVLCRL